jgi:hypothetical protein
MRFNRVKRFHCASLSKHVLSEARRQYQGSFVLEAHRDDGKRFIMRADEKLTAFMELESAIRRFVLTS